MGKAIKCTACGSFYNGSVYSSCPYCSDSGVKNQAATSEKKGDKGWRIFGKKNSAKSAVVTSDKPMTPVKPTAAEPVREPVGAVGSSSHGQTADIPRHTDPVFQDMPPVTVPVMPLRQEPLEKPDPIPGMSLSQAISRSGRTVGKYISNSGGESVAPVVGWLVGVQGAYHGQSFNLKSGRNKIGRSHEMDVKLLNDESVSRSSVAVIIFDAKAGEFSILPGESDSLCYVNNKAVYERMTLSGYEEIEFGDAGLNKYVFVPFCGERFSWADYNNTQNK